FFGCCGIRPTIEKIACDKIGKMCRTIGRHHTRRPRMADREKKTEVSFAEAFLGLRIRTLVYASTLPSAERAFQPFRWICSCRLTKLGAGEYNQPERTTTRNDISPTTERSFRNPPPNWPVFRK